MKSTLNVFRAGFAGCIAVSLLTACGDGRGMGGFKAYRSTPEQQAEWLAKQNGGQPPVDDRNQGGSPDTLDAQSSDTIDANTLADGVGPDSRDNSSPDGQPVGDNQAVSSDSVGVQPAGATQDLLQTFESEEARSQVLSELGQAPSADPEQMRVVNQADLIVANDAALNSATDTTAASLIKGISIYVDGDRTQRLLSLDAVVMVGSEPRTLHVVQAPLKVTSDGQTTSLAIVLKTVDTVEEVAPGDRVFVVGNCKDTDCISIQVRIEFTLDNGSKSAAVFLIQLTGEGYAITATNIGQPLDFTTAFAAAGGQASSAAAQASAADQTASEPAADSVGEQAVSESAPAADAPAENAEVTVEEAPDATADIANVEDIVNGGNSVEVEAQDGPGVGVLLPPTDPREEALAALAATNNPNGPGLRARPVGASHALDEAIREQRELRRAQTAAAAARRAAEAARQRYERQRAAGAYRGGSGAR